MTPWAAARGGSAERQREAGHQTEYLWRSCTSDICTEQPVHFQRFSLVCQMRST